MIAIAFLFVRMLCDCFKSRSRLEAEIVVLRHQLNVLRLRTPRRLYLRWVDRVLFVWMLPNPVANGCRATTLSSVAFNYAKRFAGGSAFGSGSFEGGADCCACAAPTTNSAAVAAIASDARHDD
jgi:hypothetical protein